MSDMTSKRRMQNIAFPRQVAMYLATQLTGMSLVSIGQAFGGRDHGRSSMPEDGRESDGSGCQRAPHGRVSPRPAVDEPLISGCQ